MPPHYNVFMHLFYEEDGGFKVGTVLAETEASFQVEAPHGKRSKIKAANVLLKFAQPGPAELLARAEAAAGEIDVDFLWEVAPREEFDAESMGREYFGHAPAPVEAAALLLRLQGAPMYFHRRGKGRYRAAPEDALRAALASVERRRQQAALQSLMVDEIRAGRLPDAMRPMVWNLLFKPDKNGVEWKALEAACAELQESAPRLMLRLGAVADPYELHWQRFVVEHFPRGTGFPAAEVPEIRRKLEVAPVSAFAIDDSSTTEIDDAFSVTPLADGTVRIGIHIAAPALAVERDSPLDALARSRMSTVYYPGGKITMQPDAVIERFTLREGRTCPALSLYVTTRPGDWPLLAHESRLELVPVTSNLRHDELDQVITEESLADPAARFAHKDELALMWEFSRALSARRDLLRGRPELNNRVDYNFVVEGDLARPADARVRIVARKRNAPLDRLVAEFMILANSLWGALLAERGVPGIYRSQQAGRVRMSTHPAPHESIGVAQYAWCTSPLRRYVDLVNQWQLIACVDHGSAAALKAPFKPRDADLFAIIGAFESQYDAWIEFQNRMERYWCLRWLSQQGVVRSDATVVREEMVRVADIPLYLRITGMPELARGTHVVIDILATDLVDLSVDARFVREAGEPADAPEEVDDAAETGLNAIID